VSGKRAHKSNRGERTPKGKPKFYTFRGYSLMAQQDSDLTPSMEDYLEMIYRLASSNGYTRTNDLAEALNVKPPSASKMVQRLARRGYLEYEPYGVLTLTPKGAELARFLLERHNTLKEFLETLGVRENALRDTERIEHSISRETLDCIAAFMAFLRTEPSWLSRYREHLRDRDLPK